MKWPTRGSRLSAASRLSLTPDVRFTMKNKYILAILAFSPAINFAYSQEVPTTAPDLLPASVACLTNSTGSMIYQWVTDDKHTLFTIRPERMKTNQDMVWSMTTSMETRLKADFSNFPNVDSFQSKISAVSCGIFSGEELITVRKSTMGNETYHALYFLWDGTQVWTGHMTGGGPPAGSSSGDYEMVRRILATITNRAPQPSSDDAIITME